MRNRFFPSLILLALLLAACGPGSTTAPPETAATAPPTAVLPTNTLAAATEPAVTAPPATEPAALPVATSRGPDLHATDPSTVSLASGGLQFVEFFRFT